MFEPIDIADGPLGGIAEQSGEISGHRAGFQDIGRHRV
jgi:hypothetical protein